MSFHWNMSSSEDEFEEEDVVERSSLLAEGKNEVADKRGGSDQGDVSGVRDSFIGDTLGLARSRSALSDSSEDLESDDDDIAWEDAEKDTKLAATTTNPLQPVTIDLNARPSKEPPKKRKRMARRVYSFKTLPADLQTLLLGIHRSHMLTLVCRGMLLSRCCSDKELLHAVHSLLPTRWALQPEGKTSGEEEMRIPTMQEARDLCTWFFDLVNRIEERRRRIRAANVAAGAPRQNQGRKSHKQKSEQEFHRRRNTMGDGRVTPQHLLKVCSYLSATNDENPQFHEGYPSFFVTDNDKTQLLVSLARSLGWRARFVVALDPIKRDLDVDHPVLANTFKNMLNAVFQSRGNSQADAGGSEKRGNRIGDPARDVSSGENAGNLIDEKLENDENSTTGARGVLAWVEILCKPLMPKHISAKDGKPQSRWVHVDPGRELWNQPKAMESFFTAARHGGNKKRTIPYALAVEHFDMCETAHAARNCGEKDLAIDYVVRLTDVTPRYANAWSRTLRQRGVTGSQIASTGDGKSQDTWWEDTIRRTNRAYRKRAKEVMQNSEGAPSSLLKQQNNNKFPDKPSPQNVCNKDVAGASSLIGTQNDNEISDVIVIDDSSEESKPAAASPRVDSADDETDHDEIDCAEQAELLESTSNEAIPTSKAAFKNHPLYAIPSVLNSREVLAPDAKNRVCGIFKGELVYHRGAVSTARTSKKWLYHGRKVKNTQMGKPIKRVKARKKAVGKGFRALQSYGVGTTNDGTEEARQRERQLGSIPLDEYDGMEDLYGIWQTRPWSPARVEPDEAIPVNEYNNVELELLNPGLCHLDEPRISLVAKKLGIKYAPCLVGFEGHGGNRTPSIRGIVVHERSAELLREAHAEYQSEVLEKEYENRQQQIYKNWKKLIVGILTKDRLEREYGQE